MGMIDSGSGVSTISPATVKELKLRTIKRSNPIQVRNADGSLNRGGQWTESVKATMDTGIWKEPVMIAELNTDKDKIILDETGLKK